MFSKEVIILSEAGDAYGKMIFTRCWKARAHGPNLDLSLFL
jgi:hypothetical protein